MRRLVMATDEKVAVQVFYRLHHSRSPQEGDLLNITIKCENQEKAKDIEGIKKYLKEDLHDDLFLVEIKILSADLL